MKCASIFGLSVLTLFLCAAAAFAIDGEAPALAVSPLETAESDVSLGLGRRAWLDFRAEDSGSWAARLGYHLWNGASLYGSYLMQDFSEAGSDGPSAAPISDTPAAWNLALELRQRDLSFSSLRLEYARLDAGFYQPRGETALDSAWNLKGAGRNFYFPEDTSVWYMGASQQWNNRFSTFQRYARYEGEGVSSASQWGVGVGYRYSPGLKLEFSYSDQSGALDDEAYKNRQVRLRAMVTF